jgi:hypothetical protein
MRAVPTVMISSRRCLSRVRPRPGNSEVTVTVGTEARGDLEGMCGYVAIAARGDMGAHYQEDFFSTLGQGG